MNQFIVIGTNFTKADSQIRSLFAITPSTIEEVFEKAKEKGLVDFFVLSTCNRTEFYACAPIEVVQNLVMTQLNLKPSDFNFFFYVYTGIDAVRHLFRVAAGMDSQIIGDYEIVGQLKMAIQSARQHGTIGTITDRISSSALQASKEVKAKTNLSSGKYSVSYAAAELISSHHQTDSAIKLLIVGIGKFGQALARNLREYFPSSELTLCNRTHSHSEELAEELNAKILHFENFTDHLQQYDAVIMATQVDNYLIKPEHLGGETSTIFLDLGIPHAIDPQVKSACSVELYSVDEVSDFHNALIQQRHMEIPKAELILDFYINQFMQWQNVFHHRDIIKTYKARVNQFHPHEGDLQSNKIDKLFSKLIQNIRVNGYQGCQVIEALNEVIEFKK